MLKLVESLAAKAEWAKRTTVQYRSLNLYAIIFSVDFIISPLVAIRTGTGQV
jgi:hypothetical protein